MFSTKGRTRVLTNAQVSRILQWQRERKTVGQVARENRVSSGTIYTVIRNGGKYKRSLPLTDTELRRFTSGTAIGKPWSRSRGSTGSRYRPYKR